ncbi:hypothetical protein LB545_13170 [Mesorhizobium sp. BR1-1-6]|uniref:hypothetical protein n=1 Tax=Mesorhizobium sp. BR1-1-6 TaxID=2876648 RepID=UPI001CD0EF11|nr:hypothetical protein [Mesorhizobium sp. BR1-1-6]MBZ9895274.1 hypothetical protein [Mesorhizobium sp. BR1-1-6]
MMKPLMTKKQVDASSTDRERTAELFVDVKANYRGSGESSKVLDTVNVIHAILLTRTPDAAMHNSRHPPSAVNGQAR